MKIDHRQPTRAKIRTSARFVSYYRIRGTQMGSIRWARGLFRLWIVLAVLWIGAVGFATWQDLNSGRPLTDEEVGILPGTKPRPLTDDELRARPSFDFTKPDSVARPPINYPRMIAISLLPPGFVLLLGCALYWVFSGFRSRSEAR
jgi:hypothetical protein